MQLPEIETALVRLAKAGVGDYLSLTGGESASPAVIITRPNAVVPKYPYIILSSLNSSSTFGRRVRQVLEGDEVKFYKHKTVLFQYTVRGSDPQTGLTALQIAEDLEGYMSLPQVQESFCQESEAQFSEVFDAEDSSSEVSGGDYVEAAILTFTITYWKDITPKGSKDSTGVFDRIEIEGFIQESEEVPTEDSRLISAPL